MSSEEIPGGGPYKAATGHHEAITADSIKAIRRQWALYCSEVGANGYCENFMDLILRTSALIAKARLEEAAAEKGSVDEGLLRLRDRVLEFYSLYISGALVSRNEKVMGYMEGDALLPNGLYLEQGSVVIIGLGEAAALYGLGLLRPVRTTSLELMGGQGLVGEGKA